MFTKYRCDQLDAPLESYYPVGFRDPDDLDAPALKLSIAMNIMGHVLIRTVVLSSKGPQGADG